MPERNLNHLEIDDLWALLQRGEHETLLARAEPHLTGGPAPLRLVTATALIEIGQAARAIQLLRQLAAEDDENPIHWMYLALALIDAGERREAGEIIGRIPLIPQQQWIGAMLERSWPEFLSTCDPSAEIPPIKPTRRATSAYSAATKAFFAGDLEGAWGHAHEAFAASPETAEIVEAFAFLSAMTGRPGMALTVLSQATAPSDESSELPAPPLLVVKALALHQLGRNSEALNLLSIAGPEGPDDWNGHFVAAVSWLSLGNRDKFRQRLMVVFRSFFIDSWEGVIRPHLRWYQARLLFDGSR